MVKALIGRVAYRRDEVAHPPWAIGIADVERPYTGIEPRGGKLAIKSE